MTQPSDRRIPPGAMADTPPLPLLSVEDVLQRMQTSRDGLSETEAAQRLASVGPNALEADREGSLAAILASQFKNPLIYLLLGAAAVTWLLGHIIDTWVILAVVLLNAAIGFMQEYRADQAIRSLMAMAAPKARVLRGGREREIASEELVPGDVVLLASGARIPADIRLVETVRLRVEEAALTGESEGVSKGEQPMDESLSGPVGQKNVVFMGTTVLAGRATGVVSATGPRTELGRISQAVQQAVGVTTPLQDRMHQFGRVVALAVVGLAVMSLVLGMLAGIALGDMMLATIAMVVAAIPEGLPVVVTVTLAVGVRRMARRRAIVRNLPAVETLGSCTVIASDKTGTLTKNQMTVQTIYAGGRRYAVEGVGFEPKGAMIAEDGTVVGEKSELLPALRWTLRVGLLASESRLGFDEETGYTAEGDPTEVALIVAAHKAGMAGEVEAYRQLDEIPFESQNMYMASLVRDAGSEETVLVKGAPERVLGMCDRVMDDTGRAVILDDDGRDAMRGEVEAMARRGLRVLAMAYRPLEQPARAGMEAEHLEHLVLAGLQGMVDPPREEVQDAVRRCREAGIRVIMVTGDNGVTGSAIAHQLGIAKEGADFVLGSDLEAMDDATLREQLRSVNVFARVAPVDKQRIVERLLELREVVAVTGDGVNDAPALKSAHIGVAMGLTGTDAAKEAADMVITDDNFASIVAAVEEGRVVYDNIRKVVFFLLPTGVGVIFTILYAQLTGLPLPFLPAQILWLNLVTNGLQDLALAFEPGDPDVLRRKPRDPAEPILSRLLIERLVLVAVVLTVGTVYAFQWQLGRGTGLEEAQTMALTTAVLFQMFHVFNSRSEIVSVFRMPLLGNPFLFFAVVASLGAQLLLIYLPSLQFVFRTAPLGLEQWVVILPVAATVIAVVEVEKWLRRRRSTSTSRDV